MEEEEEKDIKIRLEITCPGAFKIGKKCDPTPKQWSWKGCGHKSLIDDRGYISCDECHFEFFIQFVGFKCSHRNHGNFYEKYSATNLLTALSWAMQSVAANKYEDQKKFKMIMNLMVSLKQNWDQLGC